MSDFMKTSFSVGDEVTALSVGENNWLRVSRVRDGKTETGYVDWRYVKPKEVVETGPNYNCPDSILLGTKGRNNGEAGDGNGDWPSGDDRGIQEKGGDK